MGNKEFNLSEKIRIEDDHQLMLRNEIRKNSGYGRTEKNFDETTNEEDIYINLKDIKEFIRLLKERLKGFSDATCYGVSKEIDKLAGDVLK